MGGRKVGQAQVRLDGAATMNRQLFALTLGLLVGTALTSVASGQETTGIQGSPEATTTIPGNQLPPPDPKFGGVINEEASESTPWWPPRIVPPKGAPNVLLIMTDDQGFGAPSTFGGVIPTPTMDRIAAAGLRYTKFPLNIPVLTDAGGNHYGPQPSLGWLRGGG
jgi:hypothetical protein